MLAAGAHSPAALARRHTPELVLRLDEKDGRKERLRQLFGQDFPGAAAADKGQPVVPEVPGPASDEQDPLAGRRVRKQQTTSDMEQLLNVSARFDGLRTLVDGVRKNSVYGSKIVPGSICIARRDSPRAYVVCGQAYEVTEIYYQGLRGAEVERVPVPALNSQPPEGCAGYTMYLKLYSEEYHTEPVTVRPEEVAIVSLGEEVLDSLKIGVPILSFWFAVIALLLAYGELSSS